MRSEEIFQWLVEKHPDALEGREPMKFRASINSTLSGLSRREDSLISKFKDASGKNGYIWRMTAATEEGTAESNKRGLRITTPPSLEQDQHHADVAMETSFPASAFDEQACYPRSEGGDTIPDTSATEGFAQTLGGETCQVNDTAANHEELHSNDEGGDHTPTKHDQVALDSSSGSDHESDHESEHESPQSRQLRYGKMVMELQALSREALELETQNDADRGNLADLVWLGIEAEHARQRVHDLETATQKARIVLDGAVRDLELAHVRDSQIRANEEKARQIRQGCAEIRAKLHID